jgi:3-methylcrotonyl-CoA carboxylase alpha subunit
MSAPPVESVLVANRGEIALRVMRTCRRLGVRTIGVYSDADAAAPHVVEADEAYRIGPPPATESYLNAAAILEVARAARAVAVHPGYGFLAENADFAERCTAAGLVWIGPPPAAMRALGDKSRAKALAEQHHVPVLAGYHGADQARDTLAAEAHRIGFPVLIKASAGGGGRGMRVVETSAEFDVALEAARREALSSFGDDRVLLERYVRQPRHVEVQILADQHGHVVHLGERECSIQRRHQKLIEESPSPAVDARLRAEMGGAAIRLARAAGYANAGTVEFLLDERGAYAFLEVNARLQVEHPVTEAVTGLDLVEHQLRIAAGEPLGLSQDQVELNGHAIEVRVIAEDPLAGFLPSSGTVTRFVVPPQVRTDTWIRAGAIVSPYYDSLLAKVIGYGRTRAEAVRRVSQALRDTELEGVRHNVDLLLGTLEHPAFVAGALHTGFLDEHGIVAELATLPDAVLAAAAAVDFLPAARLGPTAPAADHSVRGEASHEPSHDGGQVSQFDPEPSHAMAQGSQFEPEPSRANIEASRGRAEASAQYHNLRAPRDPWRGPRAWRIGRLDQPAAVLRAGRAHTALVSDALDGDGVEVRVAARRLRVRSLGARLSVDGQPIGISAHGQLRCVDWQERSYRLEQPKPLSIEDTASDRGAGGRTGRLSAPMPGRIVKIAVQPGQKVRSNDPLVVLEAMKMEHVVEAPHAGVVQDVRVAVGQQVAAGALLLELGDEQ